MTTAGLSVPAPRLRHRFWLAILLILAVILVLAAYNGAVLSGGALVLLADLVARNLLPSNVGAWLNIPLNTNAITLPVGVYLALIGGPFFLFLLRRSRS